MVTTTDQVLLCMFIFSLGVGIGGGLYETRVVYPNWAKDPTPDGLAEKLISSGQAGAARRYWPLVSPASALLAIVNVFLAWHQVGVVRNLWLMSSIAIVLKSMGTYGYFVPTYIRRIANPRTMDALTLQRLVRQWTGLSPLRVVAETFAWITGMWAILLSCRA
jgi:hypothetical protein